MLKGIPKIVSPELLKVLCEMGHGDEIVIADGNFPSETYGKRVVRADACGGVEMLKAVLSEGYCCTVGSASKVEANKELFDTVKTLM